MMQVSEIKQRFNRFEECVDEAMRACQQDSNVSPRLSDSIKDLDRETRGAHDMVLNAQQQSQDLVHCIDRLEQMGDNAKQACQSASGINRKTQEVVSELHQQISTLKQQLH